MLPCAHITPPACRMTSHSPFFIQIPAYCSRCHYLFHQRKEMKDHPIVSTVLNLPSASPSFLKISYIVGSKMRKLWISHTQYKRHSQNQHKKKKSTVVLTSTPLIFRCFFLSTFVQPNSSKHQVFRILQSPLQTWHVGSPRAEAPNVTSYFARATPVAMIPIYLPFPAYSFPLCANGCFNFKLKSGAELYV